ncbi:MULTISPECIES: cysteine--tRNA ligase [Prochlorococcus]|uniref:cysteine--tRNA ligase n=1 Tax=Prochlorococcus TaxID=1218 RepID=UPI0005337279|nr:MULTISPECIES: cysteine--tRNA ligase [Prochlorococcus]KGG12133.1 Cysteinyl-tRNA synthetase [Prochlorococcus sp. MIT 0601]
MSLKLTNTLSGQVELFKSLKPNEVNIYCCGVTVYDLCHLGHARSYIAWDTLRRYFIWQGYKVTFVQNFTDIDDKILNRAATENSTMHEVSERNIKEFYKDMDSLGILRPDRTPRATQCLDEIRSMIMNLEKKGAAYSTEGDVYFTVSKHSSYGKLSGRDLSKQQINPEGRVTDKEKARKHHPFDFALWKAAKDEEPSYPSPWGKGRPGWHIECSAMVLKELGETIDIHLGGTDLIFPHHENEIAQSETANGKKLANFWLHNGMVNVGGEKMSKSIGNFTTIRDLTDKGVTPMTIRFFVLQAHYRKPLDFTDEAIQAAATGWIGLNKALALGENHKGILKWSKSRNLKSPLTASEVSCLEGLNSLRQSFTDALNNDLNTASALAVLFELARPLKTIANQIEYEQLEVSRLTDDNSRNLNSRWITLVELADVLGLKNEPTKKVFSKDDSVPSMAYIQEAIKERRAAKSIRDYKKADQIRNELKEQGIELIDKSEGITDWKRI